MGQTTYPTPGTKAHSILEYIRDNPGTTRNAIIAGLKLNPSVVRRYVSTLVERRLVADKRSDDGWHHYRVSR